MAAVAKHSGGVSLASTLVPSTNKINGLLAGETIVAGDACTIASDGTIMLATSTDHVYGYALGPALEGEPVTLFHGVVARYGSGLTPGTTVYLSGAVAGGLDDAASAGVGDNVTPLGVIIDDTRILLLAGFNLS